MTQAKQKDFYANRDRAFDPIIDPPTPWSDVERELACELSSILEVIEGAGGPNAMATYVATLIDASSWWRTRNNRIKFLAAAINEWQAKYNMGQYNHDLLNRHS